MAEMNPISKIVEANGLVPSFSGSWHEIPYTWADQVYGEPPREFAKYLFTYTNAAQWHLWDEWCDGFVSEVIEPVYFQLASDISWNIYWVSVLHRSELRQIDTQQRISFSSNTEYTRNLMISLEDLASSIPIGRIIPDTKDKEITLPSDVWMTQLEADGLDFCLSEYAAKNLDAYLKGEVHRKAPTSSAKNLGAQRLTKLESILIPKTFRAHFYPKDWMLPFQNVNLLYGLNGSGKTSLLSAIELAITGQVRGLKEEELERFAPVQGTMVLTVETEQGVAALHPPQTSAEEKERERQFYKSRNAKRPSSQLQSLFHRFNYLSADEAFQFVRQQPNFSDIFSRILYGPETQEMWRSLERYKSECSARATKYEEALKDLNGQMNVLPEAPPADEVSFRAYLAASGLRFAESPLEILMEAQRILLEYDKVQGIRPVPSQSQLAKEELEQSKRFYTLSEEKKTLTEKLQQAQGLESRLRQETERMGKELQSAERMVSAGRELEPLANQLRFCMDHKERVSKYQVELAQLKTCESTIRQLNFYIESCETRLSVPPVATPQQLREYARQKQKEKSDLQKQLEMVQSQIDQQELAQENRTRLFSVLSTTGLEIYQLEKHRHICPLCGAEGITETVLRKHLEERAVLGDQQLQELYRESLALTNAVKKAEAALKNTDQQEIIAQDYQDALLEIQQKFPNIHSAVELRQAYNDAQEQQTALKREVAEIERYLLEELEKVGISELIDEVCASRQRLLNSISPTYTILSSNASNEEVVAAFRDLLQKWRGQEVKCKENLTQKQNALEQQERVTKEFQLALEQNRSQLEQLNQNSWRLDRFSAFWKAVGPVAADASLNGEAVRNICQRIHDLAYDIIESVQGQRKKEALQRDITGLQEKLSRCNRLLSALGKLLPPDSYANEFICQNVSQISRIFLAIHSPQEFSKLDIENDQLIAFRNDERVPIDRMSTGQRAALVISVFFQMNLATPSAPGFLLLDEPVSNIDDLNVLTLMDFLREIAVTHKRQIFFTTANRNIAKLFRRKFNFLMDDFQELRFFRGKEHSLQIVKRSYNQSRLLESTEL